MAYVMTKKGKSKELPYLPFNGILKSGREVVFDSYKESDVPELHAILKDVIEEGQTFPYESAETEKECRELYLAYDAFVVRDKKNNEVLGSFYIKPNYPGRSSHICNSGFMVKYARQGEGVATFLVPQFLRISADLGYLAVVFNLVYVSNEASMRLWKRFGFKQIGRVPKAGNLKGLGYVDALQFYYDLVNPENNSS